MNKSYAHLEKSPPSYKSLTPISRMTCKTDLKEPNFRLKLKQFKSKEEKVAEYNNSLKKINSIIDRYDHYESKSELEKLNKTMHDKVIDNLTNLRCVKSYLETNFELVTENENPGILVKLLDILMNAQDYQGCMTCTCKEIRSLSPIKKNWHHQSKENSKNYVAKSFILKQQPEKCVKCDCIVIGKNSSGICE